MYSSHDHTKLGDFDHHQIQIFNEKTQASPSTMPNHGLSYSNVEDQGSYYPKEAPQQEANNFVFEGGSSDDHGLKLCLRRNESGQEKHQMSRHQYHNIPTKWLPSKLRLVRRMMGSDRTTSKGPDNHKIKFEDFYKEGSSSSPMGTTENRSTPIRVCSDCNTTKTPLWRSGPRGPKSLCNACGIRQRKARRALAAAAAAANGTTVAAVGRTLKKPKVQQKNKKLKINTQMAPPKKRYKHGKNDNKIRFEDFLISLSKNSAFHQVFPQDEKEAAILLMALSCGLVHG